MDVIKRLLATVTLLALAGAAGAERVVTFSSGERQVALLELFTSQGCSSCPPADRWLSNLRDADGLWRDFVPLALHVDYWDYIGWQDPFASAAHSQRQRQHVAEGGGRVVYTPGFFVNGQEWRGRRVHDLVDDRPTVGVLGASMKGASVTIDFRPTGLIDGDLIAYVALLGMDLETSVRAGENAGKTLTHDFVVLGLGSAPIPGRQGQFGTTLELPATNPVGDRRALVAWVSLATHQAPLQAVGGFLEPVR